MALTLGRSQSELAENADYSDSIFFEDDGYYWFLYPYFERMHGRTGQMIDLYDDAVFETTQFPVLLEILDEALIAIEQQPAEWNVVVGRRGKIELHSKVLKYKVHEQIMSFIALINRAMVEGRSVVGMGD